MCSQTIVSINQVNCVFWFVMVFEQIVTLEKLNLNRRGKSQVKLIVLCFAFVINIDLFHQFCSDCFNLKIFFYDRLEQLFVAAMCDKSIFFQLFNHCNKDLHYCRIIFGLFSQKLYYSFSFMLFYVSLLEKGKKSLMVKVKWLLVNFFFCMFLMISLFVLLFDLVLSIKIVDFLVFLLF